MENMEKKNVNVVGTITRISDICLMATMEDVNLPGTILPFFDFQRFDNEAEKDVSRQTLAVSMLRKANEQGWYLSAVQGWHKGAHQRKDGTVTLDQAKNLKYGDILHHANHRNADGTPQRWRVTGKVKTWKKDASRIYVPIKHGMYNYDHLDEHSLDLVNKA